MDMERGAIGRLDAREVSVAQGAIGAARADSIRLDFGAVGAAMARDMQVSRAGIGSVLAGQVRMDQAAVRMLVARDVVVERPSFVGFLVAPRISVAVQERWGFAPLFITTSACYAFAVLALLVFFGMERQPSTGGDAL